MTQVIRRVRIVRFKRFADETFDLSGDPVVLAGPNNSGKTTLLQAISAWNLALNQWLEQRGTSGANKKRISLVLDEFSALPLREMNLLWLDRHTAKKVEGKKTPKQAPIYIQVDIKSGQVEESLTIEFLYANAKLLYIRPVTSPDSPEPLEQLPDFAEEINVVHVPAFSGIDTQEPKHAIGMQNKLIGEGRPGEIVRNLILDIWDVSDKKSTNAPWSDITRDLKDLFHFELLPPEFSSRQPYILVEYTPPSHPERTTRAPKLDIANAGSGFHQVLLLLAFFYARPSSILLLDEPDAHLHFILQREVFDLLRIVAKRRDCKLVLATHAEVLLQESEAEQIISFVGNQPKRLIDHKQKQDLRQTLQTLSSLDLVSADQVGAVLYVEDESDHKILREWSRILDHPAHKFLNFAYVYPMHGKGNLSQAKKHFSCLKIVEENIKSVCVLDRDGVEESDTMNFPRDMKHRIWNRYEIENYLINPDLLIRYTSGKGDLFSNAEAETNKDVIEEHFAKNFPSDIEYTGSDTQVLNDIKGSDFIVDLLNRTSQPLPKRDLYMLASEMHVDEIHQDIIEMLDLIAGLRLGTDPMAEVGTSAD